MLPSDYLSREFNVNDGESSVRRSSERKGSVEIESLRRESCVIECYRTEGTDNELDGREIHF